MVKRGRTAAKIIAYTPSLGRAIARQARSSRAGRFHVISSISDETKWNLVSEGSTKPIKVFNSSDAAVSYLRRVEKMKHAIHVVIHNKDGGIQEKLTLHAQRKAT